MNTKTIYLLFLLWLSYRPAVAQSGFYLPPGKQQMDIPFEYVNNFIILNLTINKRLPLKFIFDTGAEHTILSKREISDLLNIRYEREFKFTGSDMKTELIAYLARDIRFDITEKTAAPKEDIFVLQEDYFRFEEYAGINIHGILAAGVFSKFIIKINYQKQIITLYDRKYFKLHEDGFVPIPVEIFRNKIYFHTRIQVVPDSFAPVNSCSTRVQASRCSCSATPTLWFIRRQTPFQAISGWAWEATWKVLPAGSSASISVRAPNKTSSLIFKNWIPPATSNTSTTGTASSAIPC